jgi:hypothetical protein
VQLHSPNPQPINPNPNSSQLVDTCTGPPSTGELAVLGEQGTLNPSLKPLTLTLILFGPAQGLTDTAGQ